LPEFIPEQRRSGEFGFDSSGMVGPIATYRAVTARFLGLGPATPSMVDPAGPSGQDRADTLDSVGELTTATG
jgi:hypothetical protein